MGIKAVIFDISKTTINEHGDLQDGIHELVNFCIKKDIKILFATNDTKREVQSLLKTGIQHDLIITPQEVRKRKPSPAFVEYVESKLNLQKGELLYIGDDDKTDAYCAANAKVLYISAKWANDASVYGIPSKTPLKAKRFIERYLLKGNLWSWSIERYDANSNRVRVFSLLNAYSTVRRIAIDTLKRGVLKHRYFFLSHLISSIYMSGLYKDVDYWVTYPSHEEGGSINPIMEQYLRIATQEFRKKYIDVFRRHTASHDSGLSRASGRARIIDFKNQIETVCLSPQYKRKLRDKRVLVIDDFSTRGYSFECARNLLYAAGALDVICVCVGKYHADYLQVSPRYRINPFLPVTHDDSLSHDITVYSNFNERATAEIENSIMV